MSEHRRRSSPDGKASLVAHLCHRLAWLGLLMIHVAGLPSAWAALWAGGEGAVPAGAALRLFGLSASGTLFFLKVLDVSWLRFAFSRRAVVVAALILALIHVDVVERATGHESLSGTAPVLAVVAGTCLSEHELLRRWVRALARVCLAVGALLTQSSPVASLRAHAYVVNWRPDPRTGIVPCQGPRAPPA